MATLNNKCVKDYTKDTNGNEKGLKYYGDDKLSLSENARVEFDPLVFESYGKICRVDNATLARSIKEMYQKVFHDLKGVNIRYIPGAVQPFMLEMYFSKNPNPVQEGTIENLIDLSRPQDISSKSFFYQKQAIDNKANGKHYTLNDVTKLLLSDIMYGGKNANKPNNKQWNNYISETPLSQNNMFYGRNSVEFVIRVAGCFDIHRVLRKLYGNNMVTKTIVEEDSNGNETSTNVASKAAYELRFIKYMGNNPNIFIINIEQFSEKAVEEMTIRENPMTQFMGMNNNIVMY